MSAAQIDPVKLERKRALQRAGLAAVAALVLLIGMLVAEDGREPEAAVAQSPELPVRSAPVTPAPAASTNDRAADTADTAKAGSDPVAAQTALAPTADEQGVAAKASEAPAPAVAVIPVVPGTATPVAADKPKNAMAASTTPASAAPAAPLPDGYLVQLGVFGAMENAEALRANVAALGMPARIEGRVVVGPFRDKAAADAAQGKLRREGMAVGFVVPPRAGSAGARPGK